MADQTVSTNSAIIDAMQCGAVWPTYTWRKGGSADPSDNHYYLIIGDATEVVDTSENVLIEIDPTTKMTKFQGRTELLGSISFDENSLEGRCIVDGSLSASKLAPGIEIDGSVKKLTNARLIDGIAFDGSANITHYGVCNSAASTVNKIAKIENFNLTAGASVYVRFANGNTAANVTLNVSDTGAKSIKYDGKAIASGSLKTTRIYHLIYDGTNYTIAGEIDTNSDINVYKTLTDTDTNSYPIYFAKSTAAVSGADQARISTNLKYTPSTNNITVNGITSSLLTGSYANANSGNAIITNTHASDLVSLFAYRGTSGVTTITAVGDDLQATYTANADIAKDNPTHTVTLLDRNGNATFPNKVTAKTFDGTVTNALTAINDSAGNNIAGTYLRMSDAENKYLQLTGGDVVGIVNVPAIAGESNTQISTVGYVDKAVTDATAALEQKIVGASGSFENLEKITELVNSNKDALETLTNATNNFVSFNEAQNLSDTQQQTARTNIGAFGVNGGNVVGNVNVYGTIDTTKIVADNIESQGNISIVDQHSVVGIAPSADNTSTIKFTDSNSKQLSAITSTFDASQTVTSSITANQPVEVNGKSASLSVAIDKAGNVATSAPTPPFNVSDNSIATTNWVQNAIAQSSQSLQSKTYTNVLAADLTTAGGTMYYAMVTPTTSLQPQRIRIAIEASTSYTDYGSISVVELIGVQQTYNYKYWINYTNPLYRSYGGFGINLASNAGINNSIGHLLNLAFNLGTNQTASNYARRISVYVIEKVNCTIDLLDSISSTPEQLTNNSAVYTGNTTINTPESGFYTSNTADADTSSKFIVKGRACCAGDVGCITNTLVCETPNGLLNSFVTVASSATTKPIAARAFKPSGVFYYSGATLAAGGIGAEDTVYSSARFDLTTSFNFSGTLNANDLIYIRGTYDRSNHLFTPATTNTVVNSLPAGDDGYQYLHIGYASGNGTYAQLIDNHTIYGYVNQTQQTIYGYAQLNNPTDNSNDYTPSTTAQTTSKIKQSFVNPLVSTNSGNAETYIAIKADTLTKGEDPTEEIDQHVAFVDSAPVTAATSDPAKSQMGSLSQEVMSDDNALTMYAYNPSDTSTAENTAAIGVGFAKNGSTQEPYTYADTPPADDNSTQIATTEWVVNKMLVIDGGIIGG